MVTISIKNFNVSGSPCHKGKPLQQGKGLHYQQACRIPCHKGTIFLAESLGTRGRRGP